MPPSRRHITAALVLTLLIALGACSQAEKERPSAQQVLAAAKAHLDRTSGVHLVLSTEQLPKGVNGLVSADGVGTHAPGFEGTLKVATSGITADAAVISVDRAVWAKLPFTTKFVKVDPADFGAPDPAGLMDPNTGLSSLLTAMKNPRQGDPVREGDQVLTQYTGTVPGRLVASIVPGASPHRHYDATFTIGDDDVLHEAVLRGAFYAGSGDVTYTITFDQYGLSKKIAAP